ncbi:hypothetical protein MMAN_30290 [Mycobacterium mantenii]|uniref:Uncharacterized protein n=1 Tax=Mycobacterium mantenii TaxID=560555 RepID=A0ABM7JTJ4_MYCNT|nr:hypothetical protein MMAN_30290 [Mycobacterium mantenii]
MADAAAAANVPRLVQESVAMIYREGADRWIDENWPTDHYPVAVGNHAAEANARRFGDLDGMAVILRFGVFYGVGAAHSEQIMGMACATWHFKQAAPKAMCRRSTLPMPPTRWWPHSLARPAPTTSLTINP